MIGPRAGDIVTGGFCGEGDYVVPASAIATRQGFGLITCCAVFASLHCYYYCNCVSCCFCCFDSLELLSVSAK